LYNKCLTANSAQFTPAFGKVKLGVFIFPQVLNIIKTGTSRKVGAYVKIGY